MAGERPCAVVADVSTRAPLPFASVFDRHGKVVGVSDRQGRLPSVSSKSYPLTIRYLGFDDKRVNAESVDTIFLRENSTSLPEVVVDSRKHKLLHVLAYVREYSTMSTYYDTVFLFREKMVDYMLPPDRRVKFSGRTAPRTLTSRSYYRFTDDCGLDSVSDLSNHHFSWSDWIGMAPALPLPPGLVHADIGADTLRGKYSPYEIWDKHYDKVAIDVDVLADTASRRWVPGLSGFFRKGIDYDYFKISFRYDNVDADVLAPADLNGYSFRLESRGRGRDMFRFNRYDEPIFVSTEAEVYILDKEYVTEKDARKWADRKFDIDEVGIFEAADAPPLSSDILALIDRVNNIDRDLIRQETEPDRRMIAMFNGRDNFKIGNRALLILKQLTGISSIKFHKNRKKNWKEFRSK
ncbi:MAG: carboxypeptidase-like regulatory domain-containing protein, partial [Muribaculaceae bacterium]|nr:carboxypeptidase-like regulatory domain-containing protein [Muribaculaceae bacterium]